MRLNRVLLLAATISIMMFALVFTISCSDGNDGKAGKDGKSCVIEADGSSWSIVCDGKTVGTMEGIAGKDGIPGKSGNPGKDGSGCWLTPIDGVSGYDIICGTGTTGAKIGTLDGCSASGSSYDLTLDCGTTKVFLCSGIAYSPSLETCVSGELISADAEEEEAALCNGVEYNKNTHSCGFGEWDTDETGPRTIFPLCKKALIPSTTDAGVLVESPNNSDGDWELNKESWNNDYCSYISATKKIILSLNDEENLCDGQPLNNGSWQTEYCGFTNSSATKRTVQKGACDIEGYGSDYEIYEGLTPGTQSDRNKKYVGPNQRAFGQGYCMVDYVLSKTKGLKDDGKPYTQYSEELCGASGTPNKDSYKREYCGWTKPTNTAPSTKSKVYNDACFNGEEPQGFHRAGESNDESDLFYSIFHYGASGNIEMEDLTDDEGYNARNYCGYSGGLGNSDNRAEASNTTVLFINATCGDNGKPNATKWNNEYCGYNKIEDFLAKDADGQYIVLNNADWVATEHNNYAGKNSKKKSDKCDDGEAPFMILNWNGQEGTIDGATLGHADADNNYKSYCQWNPQTKRTELVGGPNAYCKVTSNGAVKGSRINDKKWAKQYCSGSTDNEKVWTNACDDMRSNDLDDDYGKPYYGSLTATAAAVARNYCSYLFDIDPVLGVIPHTYTSVTQSCDNAGKVKPNEKSWLNQYCGADNKLQSGLCGDGLGPKQAGAPGNAYCQMPSEFAKYTIRVGAPDALCGGKSTGKMNENTWQNQYCFGESQSEKNVKSCPGGMVPVPKKTIDNTDPSNPVIVISPDIFPKWVKWQVNCEDKTYTGDDCLINSVKNGVTGGKCTQDGCDKLIALYSDTWFDATCSALTEEGKCVANAKGGKDVIIDVDNSGDPTGTYDGWSYSGSTCSKALTSIRVSESQLDDVDYYPTVCARPKDRNSASPAIGETITFAATEGICKYEITSFNAFAVGSTTADPETASEACSSTANAENGTNRGDNGCTSTGAPGASNASCQGTWKANHCLLGTTELGSTVLQANCGAVTFTGAKCAHTDGMSPDVDCDDTNANTANVTVGAKCEIGTGSINITSALSISTTDPVTTPGSCSGSGTWKYNSCAVSCSDKSGTYNSSAVGTEKCEFQGAALNNTEVEACTPNGSGNSSNQASGYAVTCSNNSEDGPSNCRNGITGYTWTKAHCEDSGSPTTDAQSACTGGTKVWVYNSCKIQPCAAAGGTFSTNCVVAIDNLAKCNEGARLDNASRITYNNTDGCLVRTNAPEAKAICEARATNTGKLYTATAGTCTVAF